MEFVYSGQSAQPYAEMSGQNLTAAYVPLPSGAYAIYNSSGILQYNHADWLGSTRVVSTPNQTVTQVMSYAPFGEGYAGSGWAQFTSFGNEWTVPNSQARGLDDFLYCRYGSVQGRWISPDRAGLSAVNPADPQTWNRYAYTRNNPLSNIDPLGLQYWSCGGEICGSGSPANSEDRRVRSVVTAIMAELYLGRSTGGRVRRGKTAVKLGT